MSTRWIQQYARRHALSQRAVEELEEIVDGFSQASVEDEITVQVGATSAGVSQGEDPFHNPVKRFEVLGVLGKGGMGEVLRVREIPLNRVLAMKVIRQDRETTSKEEIEFSREVQITAQLQHPGIVSVHQAGRLEDGRPFYTMNEVRGRVLTRVIEEVHQASQRGPWRPAVSGWTFRRLIDAYLKACEAVAYAHDHGVVHRDLKPANVMLGDFGEVIVVDWGLAKVMDENEAARVSTTMDMDQTVAGTVIGTVSYMPPEQARGEVGRLGPLADVYSLGAILYHILSGRKPYAGQSPLQVLARVQSGELPPPTRQALEDEWEDEGTFMFSGNESLGISSQPSLPDDLVTICMRAMAPEPEGRCTAREVAVAVATW
ncbi:MAG: serine/threonine-protein kinase, partial [Myxococcota bacterium]|nr:serine/threonine-protein kinase [Myxococcota bacterium]